MKRLLSIALFIFAATLCAAQTPLYEVGFRYRFDNREYGHSMDEASKTIFAARLGIRAGLSFGEGHAVMTGIGLPIDFGQRTFYTTPSFVAYYQYTSQSNQTLLFAGMFPRGKLRGDYSYALFSDEVHFLDSNLEGLLYQTSGNWGSVEAVADWNDKFSADRREKFQLFSAGEFNLTDNIALGYNASMLHLAESTAISGVVDNHIVIPYAKLSVEGVVGVTLRASYLVAYQRDRLIADKASLPMGIEGEFTLTWRNCTFRNTVYWGDNLMPLYAEPDYTGVSYGAQLYTGEPFYRAQGGVYARCEIGYRIIKNRWLTATTTSVFHLDGTNFGWQQVVAISIFLHKGS